MADIQRVFDADFGVYGARKIWRQLGREGKDMARCTVALLMRRIGLRGVLRGREVRTTVSNPAVPCPLDRVNRQFHAPRPNALWLSDFTYVATWQGFVYVAFIIDAYSRRIVGWRVSRTAHADFVLDAWSRPWLTAVPSRAAAWSTTATAAFNMSVFAIPNVSPTQDRAVCRQRRRQLRQCLGREHQRPLQNRSDPQTRTLALAGSRRVCNPGMGRVV
jgi:transposase InsO family protein